MKSLLDDCFAEMQHHGDTISTQTARFKRCPWIGPFCKL